MVLLHYGKKKMTESEEIVLQYCIIKFEEEELLKQDHMNDESPELCHRRCRGEVLKSVANFEVQTVAPRIRL
jgi:hypothetical protein